MLLIKNIIIQIIMKKLIEFIKTPKVTNSIKIICAVLLFIVSLINGSPDDILRALL